MDARKATDISGGLEASPVYYARQESKHRKVFPRFVYITENLPSTGVDDSLAASRFEGCSCDHCGSGCSCIRSDLLEHSEHPFAICGEACQCSADCQNRSLSSKADNGIPHALEVFECEDSRGFGVRAVDPIPAGTFVCTYVGELISEEEARRRESLRRPGEPNFIICVQEFSGNNTAPFLKTIVDPVHYGGVGRFINHSCDPNLSLHLVRIGSVLPTICLFSRRHIAAREELTFDYGGSFREHSESSSGDRASSATVPTLAAAAAAEKRTSCLCGSQLCRGLLPYDSRLF